MIYGTVTNPNLCYLTVTKPYEVWFTVMDTKATVNEDGTLIDGDTGAALFDAVTGAPLTW